MLTTTNPRIWGELWLDEQDGSTNFKFHVEHGNFLEAKLALEKFLAVIQSRLDQAQKCPFYEKG